MAASFASQFINKKLQTAALGPPEAPAGESTSPTAATESTAAVETAAATSLFVEDSQRVADYAASSSAASSSAVRATEMKPQQSHALEEGSTRVRAILAH